MHVLRVFFLLGFLITAATATLFALASSVLQRIAASLLPPARARILTMPRRPQRHSGKNEAA